MSAEEDQSVNKVGWFGSQKVKIQDPRSHDKSFMYQNVEYTEGFSISESWSPRPEDPEDVEIWEAARWEAARRMSEQGKRVIEERLQVLVDEYYASFEEDE